MRLCGAVGIHSPKRNRGCTRAGDGEINNDLVNRPFDLSGLQRELLDQHEWDNRTPR
jgi:hypothetical protein